MRQNNKDLWDPVIIKYGFRVDVPFTGRYTCKAMSTLTLNIFIEEKKLVWLFKKRAPIDT